MIILVISWIIFLFGVSISINDMMIGVQLDLKKGQKKSMSDNQRRQDLELKKSDD